MNHSRKALLALLILGLLAACVQPYQGTGPSNDVPLTPGPGSGGIPIGVPSGGSASGGA